MGSHDNGFARTMLKGWRCLRQEVGIYAVGETEFLVSAPYFSSVNQLASCGTPLKPDTDGSHHTSLSTFNLDHNAGRYRLSNLSKLTRMDHLGLLVALCVYIVYGVRKMAQSALLSSARVTVCKTLAIDPGLANDSAVDEQLVVSSKLDSPKQQSVSHHTTTTVKPKKVHRRAGHRCVPLPPVLELPGGGYQCNVM